MSPRKFRYREDSGAMHLPPIILTNLLRLFNALVSRMTPSKIQTETSRLIELLNTYISRFTPNLDSQFNELDKVLILVNYYGAFIDGLPNTDATVMQPEEITLVYIIHYLSSQTFDKKFSAISLLNCKLDEYSKTKETFKFEMRDILLRNGILKILYVTGYHPEIAKKADKLFSFLAPLLQGDTVSRLLLLAFEQGSEKGGTLCRCIRQCLDDLQPDVTVTNLR